MPNSDREVPEAVDVADPDAEGAWRRARELLLESLLQPTEVRPPEETGDQQGARGVTASATVRSSAATAVAATISDSPRAMITNSPCRSAKWTGGCPTSDPLAACVATRSVRIASSQMNRSDRRISSRAGEDEREPDPEGQTHPNPSRPKIRGSITFDEELEGQTEDAHDEVGNHKPEDVVTERLVSPVAITNAAAVARSVDTRTTTWVVSAGLSVQVNCVHAHQISQNRTSERSTPSA